VRLKCPRCATLIAATPGRVARCPNCGFAATAPGAPEAPPRLPEPASQTAWSSFEPVVVTEQDRIEGLPDRTGATHRVDPPTRGRIAAGLALNLVLPGVGTLVARRNLEGGLQLVAFAIGIITIPYLVGLALLPAVWLWALVSSIQHYVAAGRPSTPRPEPA
jgi:hypothetical protein